MMCCLAIGCKEAKKKDLSGMAMQLVRLLYMNRGEFAATPSYNVGMHSMGNGYYYIASNYADSRGQGARLRLYEWALTETNQDNIVVPITLVS